MDATLLGLGAPTLFVDYLESSTSFHRDVLGLPVVHQDEDSTVVDLGNTLVNLLQVAAAPELVGPPSAAAPGNDDHHVGLDDLPRPLHIGSRGQSRMRAARTACASTEMPIAAHSATTAGAVLPRSDGGSS